MKSVHLSGALPVQENQNFLTPVRKEENQAQPTAGRVIKTERMNYVSFKVILKTSNEETNTSHDWYNNYE